MVAADGLFERKVVGMGLIDLRRVIFENEVVLEWPLKGFADQIFERDYSLFGAQLFLDDSGLLVLFD